MQPLLTEKRQHGVFFSDAPEGYTALVVYLRGRRIIRLEIATDFYSARWKSWLDRFHHENDKDSLKVLR